MIKLLIKTGPFYMSSFATVLLALSQVGILDRLMGPELEAIADEIDEVEEAAESLEDPGLSYTDSLDLDFIEEQAGAAIDLVLVAVVGALAITAIILLGYLYQRAWERLTRELDGR